jgi:hypothetical protein
MQDRWAKIHAFINPNLIKFSVITLFALLILGAGLLWLGRISYIYPGPSWAALGLAIIVALLGWFLADFWQFNNPPPVRVLGLELLTQRWQAFMPKDRDSVILYEQIGIVMSVAQLAYHRFSEIRLIKIFPGSKIKSGAFLLQPGLDSPLVLKFDSVSNITAEMERYERCVDQRLGQTPGKPRIPLQRYGTIEGQPWGAITYHFVGANQHHLRELQTFGEYYRGQNDLQKLVTALNMVVASLRGWWANPLWQNDECARWRRATLYREYDRLTRRRHEMAKGICQVGEQMQSKVLSSTTFDDPHVNLNSSLRLCNPLNWVDQIFGQERLDNWLDDCKRDSLVHGDFHAGNILVSTDNVGKIIQTWVIDFPHAHVGPTIQDIARLEADIKFTLLPDDTLKALDINGIYQFESFLLPKTNRPMPHLTDLTPDQLPIDQQANQPLQKTWIAVDLLRTETRIHNYMTCDDARPYYLALLHATLPILYYRDHSPWQKLYAFISAALLCERLEA